MCRSKNKTLIQIRLRRHIRLTALWLPTTSIILTTNTSLSKTQGSREFHQAMLRSRAVAAHCSHIALCNMHRERTQIFKQQWIRRIIILKIIKGIREEDRRMLMTVKERVRSTITNKIWWRWVSCQSIISNHHPPHRTKSETSRLHVTEKLLTRARSNKKFIANNSWTKALKLTQTWKAAILEKLKLINNLNKLTLI